MQFARSAFWRRGDKDLGKVDRALQIVHKSFKNKTIRQKCENWQEPTMPLW